MPDDRFTLPHASPLATIAIGPHCLVQGDLLAVLPDGSLLIGAGSRCFAGRPVRDPDPASPCPPQDSSLDFHHFTG